MSKTREKCFFSYCWDNTDNVMDLMMYLKKQIENKSSGNIQVIIDKEDFHIADNFKKKEEMIRKCDSVVIFFSSAYKTIIDKRDESRGVYREYGYILETWKNKEISVISIIVEGAVEEAITKEFRDNIAADLSNDPPIIDGKRKKILDKKYRTVMSNLVSTIICETDMAYRRKDYQFPSKEDAYSVLFCNTDSRDKLPRRCMYRTEAYNNIMSDEGTCFLVGRKGSGKSTFFEVLEKCNPDEFEKRFKMLRPISVEDIREEHLYSIVNKYFKDNEVLGEGRVIELFWEIYIYLGAIYIVSVEEENQRVRDNRRKIFHKIGNRIKEILGVSKLDSDDVKRSIFTLSVELWEDFIKDDMLEYATDESLLASIDANFNVDNVLKKLFNKGECHDYQKLVKAIEQCEKKILVALDKFDAISEDFRRSAKREIQSGNPDLMIKGEKKREFDRLLYRALIMTVEKLNFTDVGVMKSVTFCIIIPQDRVDQIKLVDRDFTKRNFTSLSWDAIELLEMILLRLKELYDCELEVGRDLIDEFRTIMKQNMTAIPLTVKIEVNGVQKEIELFQYLLAISFWRPRDIIKYFSVLCDAIKKNVYKSNQIDMETLKTLLNDVTEDIILNEFYGEYDKVLFNIEDIMNRFREKNIILSTPEVVNIIHEIEFEGVLFEERNEILGKINILYEFGVIGLKFDSKELKNSGIGNEISFVFNEGMYPFERVKNNLLKKPFSIEVVINPIFVKKLSLHYNSSEVIGAYGWEYLFNNHIRKKGINRV